jgi:putative lipoic acid-binding regulatory protein
MFCEDRDRPHIDYPCDWEYRIIGADAAALEAAVRAVLQAEEYALSAGNTSPKGRWRALRVEMRVRSEAHRDEVHRLLREHPDVKMVL